MVKFPKAPRSGRNDQKTLEKRSAVIARASHIVELLGTRFVREGWSFDKARAARFLQCLRTFDFNDGDSAEFTEILAWISDHGQSLDWIFCGDPASMISRAAHHSPGKRTVPVLSVV